ncbi:MAG TPA: hypothetical protein VJ779_16495, partial [Acetobacteraceae bacterium]|nr:hypothetical protein [Acetobacteraceae bacterium]
NTVTINGRVPDVVRVRAGERIRLRLLNAAIARIMALRFEGHRPVIVALDGQPCEPYEPVDGRILLGPAVRADLMFDMQGEPGRSYRVVDDFTIGLPTRWSSFPTTRRRRSARTHRMRRCDCRPILCRARISRPPWSMRRGSRAG